MVLSNFRQSISGTINNIYISQMLSTQALAAVSGMFPIVFFFIALVIGLGAGAGVLVGQAWGTREPQSSKLAGIRRRPPPAPITLSPQSLLPSAACKAGSRP